MNAKKKNSLARSTNKKYKYNTLYQNIIYNFSIHTLITVFKSEDKYYEATDFSVFFKYT